MSPVEVHGFAEDDAVVRRLANALGGTARRIGLHTFPDGEVLPSVRAPAAETVIIYRSLYDPGARLIPLLLAADACRRAGASRVVLAAPYLCYLRQDAVFRPGQPLSRDVILPMIGRAFDRLVTVQAHLHRTKDLASVVGAPAESLNVLTELARLANRAQPMIVGPDAEAAPWTRAVARALVGDGITLTKQRLGDRSVRLALPRGVEVAGRAAVLIDDVCSTGGTLETAIRALLAAGAASVDVAVAHALFDSRVNQRLVAAGAARILSSNSIRHPTNALDLTSVLAQALRSEVQ